VLAVVWVGIGVHLASRYRDIAGDAANDGRNLALAAEQSVEGMIARIDQTLLFLRAARATDRQHFDPQSWLRDAPAMPGGFAVSVLGRDAITLSSAAPSDGLFISEPLPQRVGGKWTVQFSRNTFAADGSVDGIVQLSVDPEWLTRLYEKLNIGQGSLLVLDINGIVLSRAPNPADSIGQSVRASKVMALTLAEGQGSIREVSPLDGLDRFISFRRLPGYPLIVGVGLNADEVFAPYAQERLAY
jgi:hypothetical protein